MGHIETLDILKEAVTVGLFISGSAADKNFLFTNEDLEALPKTEKQLFSVYDDHERKESRHIEEGTGIALSAVLKRVNAADADEVKVRSVDGFESVVSELRSRRYYFPGLIRGEDAERELRVPLVSFYKNGRKAKYYPHPTIMFGQQGLEDKNKDYFAKGARYLLVGSRERAFWVKGDGLSCNRYFGLDQIFALHEDGEDAIEQVELTFFDGNCIVPGVRLGRHFWIEELGLDSFPGGDVFAVSASGAELPVDAKAEYHLFFTGTDFKKVGFYGCGQIMEDFAGLRVGEIRTAEVPKEVRIPSEKSSGDFYIRVIQNEQETARYFYSFEELMRDYHDLLKQEDYCYYNHNMNQGKGGMRRVTGRGWKITDLLCLLPEIPNPEFIESGALQFQIFTKDTYKEKLAADGNELIEYRFLLTFEQDQRTQTGMEKGDTSTWEEEELHFAQIHGNTPFRIYCGKSSANPAVYKNAEGMSLILM